jgi:hypothetical protein
MATSVSRLRVGIPQENGYGKQGYSTMWMAVIGRRIIGGDYGGGDLEL